MPRNTLVALAAVTATLAGASSAQAAVPTIEGVWYYPNNGGIRITETSPGQYVGVSLESDPLRLSPCPHPGGSIVFTGTTDVPPSTPTSIGGPGFGEHRFLDPSTCGPTSIRRIVRFGLDMRRPGRPILLRYCIRRGLPGSGGSYRCRVFKRTNWLKGPHTFDSVPGGYAKR